MLDPTRLPDAVHHGPPPPARREPEGARNRTQRRRLAWTFFLVAAFATHSPSTFAAGPAASIARPRLLVLLVFDQLRGDYLARWQESFGDGGFRRLQREGAWFTNCHYPYAGTWTAAGHASILTGCTPAVHGVIGNEWYDRTRRAERYCVASDRYERVPPTTRSNPATRAAGRLAPDSLQAPSFADVLKESTGGRSKVVALSMKDRSAILLGGHRPDACYWFDADAGEFVTSTYYRSGIHPWVESFQRQRPADRWFGAAWERLRPDLDYRRLSGPDDVAGEGPGIKQGRTFPHPTDGGLKAPGPSYYQAVYTSPFGNELLLEFAQRAIEAEELGRDETPDLLVLSFSGNDAVGHAWGPDSQEVLDVTLRSDLIVKGLLDVLDSKVGRGDYLVALTADHGVCPLPEVSRSLGRESGRVPKETLTIRASQALDAAFPAPDGTPARWVEAVAGEWVYLDHRLIQHRGLDQGKVASALRDWLSRQPGILAAFSRSNLTSDARVDDPLVRRARQSFYPERSGDVMFVLKPYHLLGGEFATGTTHGSPHDYDRHVPLLVFGPAVSGGTRPEEVSPLAVAAILAHAAGVKPPPQADASVPAGLFKAR